MAFGCQEDHRVLGFSSVYAIDATDISAQGGTTTALRVHTQYSITGHHVSYTELTDFHGGESLERFPLQKDDLYFADRAYGRTAQFSYALKRQAHFVIRVSPHHVTLFSDPACKERICFPTLLKNRLFLQLGTFAIREACSMSGSLAQKCRNTSKQPWKSGYGEKPAVNSIPPLKKLSRWRSGSFWPHPFLILFRMNN